MTKLLETLSRATPVLTDMLWSEPEQQDGVTREEISELFANDLKDAEIPAKPNADEV